MAIYEYDLRQHVPSLATDSTEFIHSVTRTEKNMPYFPTAHLGLDCLDGIDGLRRSLQKLSDNVVLILYGKVDAHILAEAIANSLNQDDSNISEVVEKAFSEFNIDN